MNEKMLTKEELAVKLSISAYDVYKVRKKPKTPSIKIGRSYRYNLQDVENFIKKLGTK